MKYYHGSKKLRKKLSILPMILIIVFLLPVFIGCDYVEKPIDGKQNMKVYSNSIEIANIPYSSISKNVKPVDDKIAKVGTYENLFSIFDSMGLFISSSSNDYMYNGIYPSYKASNIVDDKMEFAEADVANASDAGGYSKTNNQVAEVDEADIIKTDGKYIYYLQYNQVVIIDTSGKSPKTTGKIEIGNIQNISISDLYIIDDKLIINGNRYEYIDNDGNIINPYSKTDDVLIEKMIYQYSNKSFTTFMIYDISDKSNPVFERTVEAEGYAVSTRLIGNNIYFITNKWLNSMIYDEVRDFDILPVFRDTVISEDIKVIAPADINYFPESRDSQYMLAGSFNVTKNEEVTLQAYLGSGSNIYMNTSSLYVSRTTYGYYDDVTPANAEIDMWMPSGSRINTEIYRFAIDDTDMNYIGSAIIKGSIINQYSMDEYNGILRVALGDYSYGNGITNIDINKMEVVGDITGLAVNENIYSVRFMGNVGYMVTYRQVDPLFVFDLSDPKKPVMTGELKIPGFSQYLHPVGEKYLVGFGRNTSELFYMDEKGNYVSTGQVRDLGFKLSLFDVSDLKNPKEVFVKNYPDGSYSDASYNPRSIMVDAKNDIFAFPIYQPAKDNNYYGEGGTVIKVDPEKGFVTLTDIHSYEYGYNSRFCYIGDKLYYVTQNEITVYSYPDCKFIEKVSY